MVHSRKRFYNIPATGRRVWIVAPSCTTYVSLGFEDVLSALGAEQFEMPAWLPTSKEPHLPQIAVQTEAHV